MGEISAGLSALRRRDTAFRLSATRGDELGVLADSFNQMLDGLKEMEMAKVIQTAMIPPAFPAVPGYVGVMKSLAASRLGGDYVDVLPLPGGDVLLVVGDVTGHGVGAALLMAMVKAVVMRSAGGLTGLPDLFLVHDAMVFRFLKREMLMTFLAVKLSPGNGKMQICNAGHPYPLIIRAGKGVREIRPPHRPLGVFKPGQGVPVVRDLLLPGETLALFTDGCCEAREPGGENDRVPRAS